MSDWPLGRWPIFPHPKEDELFSSWIERLAIANGTKANLLLTRVGLLSKGKSLRRIDNISTPNMLTTLAQRTGSNLAVLWGTTATEYHQHLSIGSTKRPRHLLLLGLEAFKNERYFLQFCPLCLQESSYYRRLWRMSCVVACPTHGVALHDKCAECQAPVNVFGNDEKNKADAYDGSLSRCWQCGVDQKDAPVELVDERLTSFCRNISEAVRFSQIALPGDRWCYLGSYLHIIRQLGHALLQAQRSRYDGLINDLDVLPLIVRLEIMEEVAEALSLVPESFERVCTRWGITPYMLKTMERKSGLILHWFDESCLWPISPKFNVVTHAQISSAVRLMREKGLKVNCYSVNRFMGLNESPAVSQFFGHSKLKD
ncbi:MAG: TniQ family protein [Idiomarina sp.]